MFTVYRSTDASAPTLAGQTGRLCDVLNKCLVTGYGSQSGAGWTSPYDSGVAGTADKTGRVFLQGSGSRGMYVQVVDDGNLTTVAAKEATIQGYETMSAWNTGTGSFPTSAQNNPGGSLAGGLILRKSASADGTARAWVVFADSRTFHMFVFSGDGAGNSMWYHFGDFFSLLGSGDVYAVMIAGKKTANLADSGISLATSDVPFGGFWSSARGCHYLPRAYTGLGGSLSAALSADRPDRSTNLSDMGVGTFTFPNPEDGGLYLGPLRVIDGASGSVRGRLRGVYCQLHAISNFVDGDTFSGAGSYSGKSFVIVKNVQTNSATEAPRQGVACMETSDTLETN